MAVGIAADTSEAILDAPATAVEAALLAPEDAEAAPSVEEAESVELPDCVELPDEVALDEEAAAVAVAAGATGRGKSTYPMAGPAMVLSSVTASLLEVKTA